MEIIDLIGITEFKSGSGVDIGFNKPIAGSIYTPSMLLVSDFDVKDWSPVFDNAVIKSFNICIGYKATIPKQFTNSIAIGNHVTTSGNNTIQLGNWDQQVLTINESAYRNDIRDMSDVQEIELGLDYISTLRPVKYKTSYRDASIETQYPFPHPINEPDKPNRPDFTDDESYEAAVNVFNAKNIFYQEYCDAVESIRTLRQSAFNSATSINVSDKFTFGFVGSELVAAAESMDSDFNPVIKQDQDNNGYPVEHLMGFQLTAPMVKAMQEMHELIKILRTDVDLLRTETDLLKLQMTEVRTALGLP